MTSDTATSLREELKQLLIEVSGMTHLSTADIGDEQSLFQDGLGLDSIDILEFVVRLDKTYGLKILNDEEGRRVLRHVTAVADAITALREDPGLTTNAPAAPAEAEG